MYLCRCKKHRPLYFRRVIPPGGSSTIFTGTSRQSFRKYGMGGNHTAHPSGFYVLATSKVI